MIWRPNTLKWFQVTHQKNEDRQALGPQLFKKTYFQYCKNSFFLVGSLKRLCDGWKPKRTHVTCKPKKEPNDTSYEEVLPFALKEFFLFRIAVKSILQRIQHNNSPWEPTHRSLSHNTPQLVCEVQVRFLWISKKPLEVNLNLGLLNKVW